MNVIMPPLGPVLIDWTNISRGPASFDAAMTVVLMSTYETSGARDRIAQKLLVSTFRRARGRSLIEASVVDACEYRLPDPNVTDGERAAIEEILARHR